MTETELDDKTGYCPACNGSGEGQYDGSACRPCGGRGEAPSPREIERHKRDMEP